MDRRNFIVTMFSSPLLAPFLLEAKTTRPSLELYLIGDTPHRYLPLLLEELRSQLRPYGQNFSFLYPHPNEKELKQSLSQAGWVSVQNPAQAHMALSFCLLSQKAFPSFTFTKEGRICDIRPGKLYSFWNEMNSRHNPSSSMTIASFKTRQKTASPGESVFLYKEGREIEKISLKKNSSKSYSMQKGRVTVIVENGKTWIAESPCKHKICVHTPPVFLAGERIVCAPNHFLLEVNGPRSFDTVLG